jgi:hypothetical protein
LVQGLYDPEGTAREYMKDQTFGQTLERGSGIMSGPRAIGALPHTYGSTVKELWDTKRDVAPAGRAGVSRGRDHQKAVGQAYVKGLQEAVETPSYKWQERAGDALGSVVGGVGEIQRAARNRMRNLFDRDR